MSDTSTETALLESGTAPAAPDQSPASEPPASSPAPNGGDTPPTTEAGDPAKPAEGDKPKDGKAEGVPEAYEFKAPEGQELDTAAVEAFTPIAKELGLTNDQAQKLVDLYAAQMANAAKGQQDAFTAIRDGWVASVRNDPEIGGGKLEGNLAIAAKAIDQFGGPELRQALNETGVGDNPAVIKFMIKVGKAISEDNFPRGSGGDPGGGKSTAELFYGNK